MKFLVSYTKVRQGYLIFLDYLIAYDPYSDVWENGITPQNNHKGHVNDYLTQHMWG